MQSVLSRIWTHVAMSISYDDNHYTTGTLYIYLNKDDNHSVLHVKHVLLEFGAITVIRKCLTQIMEDLFENVNIDDILSFLKEGRSLKKKKKKKKRHKCYRNQYYMMKPLNIIPDNLNI